jgi:beta-glucanase (GH16 family)
VRLAVAAITIVIGTVATTATSAGAAVFPWWWFAPTTTTTAKPTTTTTAKPTTTTTVKPTTTTTAAPTTTTTATPATPGAPNCTTTPVKANGTPWVCTFVDNFDGTTLDTSKWLVQTTAASNYTIGGECYMDDPKNVSVSNGSLQLTVRKEAAPVTCGPRTSSFTGGTVNTYRKWSQTYGRFEIRAKFPTATVKGLHSALWLWPDNPVKYGAWPASGEIDIAEMYSQYPDRVIPFIHYLPLKLTQTNNYCTLKVDDWHTYVAEWTATTITISFDGKVCVKDTISARGLAAPKPFDHPFMIALTQGLGVGGNAPDPATVQVPATTSVDYVRVWQ